MSHLNKSFDTQLNKFAENINKILDSIMENQKEQIDKLEKTSFNNKKAFYENNCTPGFSEIKNYGDKHGE